MRKDAETARPSPLLSPRQHHLPLVLWAWPMFPVVAGQMEVQLRLLMEVWHLIAIVGTPHQYKKMQL